MPKYNFDKLCSAQMNKSRMFTLCLNKCSLDLLGYNYEMNTVEYIC